MFQVQLIHYRVLLIMFSQVSNNHHILFCNQTRFMVQLMILFMDFFGICKINLQFMYLLSLLLIFAEYYVYESKDSLLKLIQYSLLDQQLQKISGLYQIALPYWEQIDFLTWKDVGEIKLVEDIMLYLLQEKLQISFDMEISIFAVSLLAL